jgi:hypothetical protein
MIPETGTRFSDTAELEAKDGVAHGNRARRAS